MPQNRDIPDPSSEEMRRALKKGAEGDSPLHMGARTEKPSEADEAIDRAAAPAGRDDSEEETFGHS